MRIYFIFFRSERLGKNGIPEIKAHRFFRNDQWDWNNIRQSKYLLNLSVILVSHMPLSKTVFAQA